MKLFAIFFLMLLSGCGGGPPQPDWTLNASSALRNFTQKYLTGDTRAADAEFAIAKKEISATGRADLLARAELIRCAARAASLEFDNCPGFEALRADAGGEEIAYAEYLAGRAGHAASDDALSRLVFAGVQFKSGKAAPETIASAIDLAAAQGWRRPLLAWLGVQEKRAEAAGDRAAVERIRRRILLTLEKTER